ncbi:Protein of unknown function [Sanguibacter gelidistatuariae]|uniref:DUF3152 domain-containing protein n=2 Tax=Sanguibacter gelidistatuariae TaxID=1814289 RepID=A0A1G6L1V1_9MICO|nr:Protein of unknown function [Sanguibacter gelidistatuariae]
MRAGPAVVLAVAGLVAGVGSGAAVSALIPTPPPLSVEADATSGVSSAADQRDLLLDAASRSVERTALDGALDPELAGQQVPEPQVPEPQVPEPQALPEGVDEISFAAGLLSMTVHDAASGVFDVVPGEVPAPGAGEVKSVRIEVEQGLDIDPVKFADQVLATLNDPRSWGGDGSQTFSRTAGEATLTVTLASPASVDRLCAPLDTGGLWSCGVEGRAVLNHLRWVTGSENYGDDMAAYRQYLVNHEVGHVLGHRHAKCSSSAALAPVMVQQSGALVACTPNGWPFP